MPIRKLPQFFRASGQPDDAVGVVILEASGNIIGGAVSATYYLAGAAGAPLATLAAGATTAPVTVPAGQSASYGWDAVMDGTGNTLILEAMRSNGTSWRTVATLTQSDAAPVVVFTGSGGATFRLRNAGAAAIANLTSALMN